jgi:Na+/proline symporter
MSTLDSNLFIAATTVGHDFARNPLEPETERRRTRWGLVLSAALAASGAMLFDSVVEVWHHVGSVVTSTLLLPVIAVHLPSRWRPSQTGVVFAMVLAAATSSLWILGAGAGGYPLGIEPMFAALAASASCLVIDRLRRA